MPKAINITSTEILMLKLMMQHRDTYANHPVTDDLAGHSDIIYTKRQAAAVLRSLVKKGLVEARPDKGFGEAWTQWVLKSDKPGLNNSLTTLP